jgi:CBS domain-containing protein
MTEQKLVRDLMTVGVPTCKWETPIKDIARFLLEKNVEAMCVLDVEGHGIGVVGERNWSGRMEEGSR